MRKIKFKQGKKVQPSFLDYTGLHRDIKTEMQLFVYNDLDFIECNDIKINEINNDFDFTKSNWLNIHGLNDTEKINSIGKFLGLDNFLIGDILNTTKRTKIEEYHDVLFFNIKSLLRSENQIAIDVEQISFVLKNGILVSFQEKRSDFFAHIRERIRTHSGIVRTKKVDYLLYLLLDAVMENFYITIENEENEIEKLINLTKTGTNNTILLEIEKHQDNLNFLKKSIIPLRDSLFAIKSIKDDIVFNVIELENFCFFNRLHQKSLEILEQIEYDITTLENTSNFYFASQTQKMNEVMKTLTIVSVIFMPLTFIVGVYGMNFKFMPELEFHDGYFVVLISMLLISIAMTVYFKRKKWF